MVPTADRVALAARAISERWTGTCSTAVVLGTGLGDLAKEITVEAAIPYREIPGFLRVAAPAHKGQLICGRWHDAPIVMLQGRCHAYEGHASADLALPVQALAALGIKNLVVTNAAGGLNPNFAIGDVMLIDDHINLMGVHFSGSGVVCANTIADRSTPSQSTPDPFPSRQANFYDTPLAAHAERTARQYDFPLRRGTYIAVSGPSYETRAEYRAFRRLGGDCVGMSTVPEVLAAAACGLKVLGLSTVTNVARPDAPQKVTAEEVVAVAATALPKVRHIIRQIVALPG